MARRHALFCILHPDQRGHGLFCVSRPIARPVVASSETGKTVEVSVDLAARWTDPDGLRLVRVVNEPPNVDGQFVVLIASGSARHLAAALLIAAGQAEELERDVTRPRPTPRSS